MQHSFTKSVVGLVLLLAGCARPGPAAVTAAPDSAPRLATATESLHTVIPPGMQLGLHRSANGSEVAEYIPAGETMADWTNMFALGVTPRRAGLTVQQLAAAAQQGMVKGCAIAPAATRPTYFTDGDLPAVALGVSCGRATGSGRGELVVIKSVLGNSAVFTVQRAFRLPPAADSAALKLPPNDDVADRLRYSFVCSVQNPAPRCK
jgi:hypothetical protein